MAERILKLFSPSGSHKPYTVFFHTKVMAIFRRGPPS